MESDHLAKVASYGHPVIDESGPRSYYWPVTVQVRVECSRTADPGTPKSLLSVPDASDTGTTILQGTWIQRQSYLGSLARGERGQWEVRWPQ